MLEFRSVSANFLKWPYKLISFNLVRSQADLRHFYRPENPSFQEMNSKRKFSVEEPLDIQETPQKESLRMYRALDLALCLGYGGKEIVF